jgi:hypothetical protein
MHLSTLDYSQSGNEPHKYDSRDKYVVGNPRQDHYEPKIKYGYIDSKQQDKRLSPSHSYPIYTTN